jgi:metal-responsive CopG/Arc/MetJ family transcriptional regulator
MKYGYLVRVKTSVTLPEDLLKSIDKTGPNRSAFIERACRAYLARLQKAKRDARDAAIINANADRLNEEAMDVLRYQKSAVRRKKFRGSQTPASPRSREFTLGMMG